MVDAPSGSRNEETRRRNLSVVMRTVHYSGATTRAELTKLSGLNRSTIKALVDELTKRGLVFETEAEERGSVGRPSPRVNPAGGVVVIAVNPDVDAVVVGRVGLNGRVHERVRVEVDGAPTVEQAAALALKAVESMPSSDARVAAVGVAVPGLVRSTDHVVVDAPHLDWRDEDVSGAFSLAFGVPAFVDNDASAGLLAESRFGAVNDDNVVYINGSSSGIGGAVVVDGDLLQGASGFAGEIGHTRVRDAGDTCRCGRTGCLETEVNLPRLAAAAGASHVDPDRVGDLLLGNVAPAVVAEVDRQIDVLALAIANAISNFNPGVVALAGFVGALFDVRPSALPAAIERESFYELAADVRVVRASLGVDRLMIGAAELGFKALLRDPAEWDEANATLSAGGH